MNKPAFGSVIKVVQSRLVGFGDGFFNAKDFQRPYWVGRSSPPTYQFTGLVQLATGALGGNFFRLSQQVLSKVSGVWRRRPCL